MAAKLTVLIPCKDEERNIRACIASVQSLADEILVADSGSTDDTLEIVRDLGGCRVIEREYINSANFKNWAIPQARHEWVLIVDADERVTPELAAEIRHLLDTPSPEIDGYWIGRLNYFLGYPIRHCGWNSDDVLRLIRRDKCRYQDRWVHAEVELPEERSGQLKASFEHYTTWSSDHYFAKLNRYATWGAMNMRDRSKKPSLFGMITRAPLRFFQLYFLRLGFLDGVPGFQVCMVTAFYSFLKQMKLWEMHNVAQQRDLEADSPSLSIDDARRQRHQPAAEPQATRRGA